jgi:hypothetical protein
MLLSKMIKFNRIRIDKGTCTIFLYDLERASSPRDCPRISLTSNKKKTLVAILTMAPAKRLQLCDLAEEDYDQLPGNISYYDSEDDSESPNNNKSTGKGFKAGDSISKLFSRITGSDSDVEPSTEQLKASFAKLKNLDNEPSTFLTSGWIGVEGVLGAGGQGCTRLFVKLDENGCITSHLAVKESYVTAYSWNSQDFWQEDRYHKDPREAIVHKLCTLPTDEKWEKHIVQYRSHSVNPKHRTHRLYMEYASCGDLHAVYKAQRRK